MSDNNKSYVTEMPEIPVLLVITDGSKEENKKNAKQSILDTLKILKLDMNPKIYIDFFNLLYDQWDDAIKAMDHIHQRIQSDCYLIHLMKMKSNEKLWKKVNLRTIPKDTTIIAFIDIEKEPKPNQYQHFGKFVTVGFIDGEHFVDMLNGMYCDSYFYDLQTLIAWMPMPKPPKQYFKEI